MAERWIGLISGTSVDAVDAALVEFDPEGHAQLVATHGEPPPGALRRALLKLTQDNGELSPAEWGKLDQQTGAWFAAAAESLIAKAGVARTSIRAIGSHGQTVYHHTAPPHPFSLQLGDPNLIAARTGLTTVADFRRADMAQGGQGAPLVPAFHHALFSSPSESRCVINIGGIANITRLPAGGRSAEVSGFDTGPGNALLDAWTQEHRGQAQDTDAAWAASGQLDQGLLQQMLQDDYFAQPPPKSTGREIFNLRWLQRHLACLSSEPAAADMQRTLLELSVQTIANAIDTHAADATRILVCGGGAHNPLLQTRLGALLAPRELNTTGAFGMDGDWVEAATFAWLAMRTLHGLSGNIPGVTGAERAVVLGGIYAPLRRET